METLSNTLTNIFVLAALLTDYLVLFDFWILTPPSSPTGPPTPQRKRWLAGLKTTVCYAITQPLWSWAVAASSADGVFWILMASYAALLSGSGALAIFSAGVEFIVKEHNENCLILQDNKVEDSTPGSVPKLETAAEPGQPRIESGEIDSSEAEKATLSSRAQQQRKPCTRHTLPSSYYLAILLPTLTAAAADSALLFFARFLTSKNSMDWIQESAVGWKIFTSVAAFSYAGSKVMNWMAASFANRGRTPGRTQSWRVWVAFGAEKAMLLLILFMLRSTLRVLLGQKVFLGFTWNANNLSLRLIGPLLNHGDVLQPAATKKILGINWYALPRWTTWLTNGIVAVGQVWWIISGPMRRNRAVREENFTVTEG
ncbi:hypothetical protein LTR78_003546 [Recurvomyces mirabilis]|uniref:Uncharacterized protein n=1 Tax=Recurvomyces mirabilis TaxID=574656 RepID=A0AAE0WRM1_9PEZI|nr:hypothetical protein LTR78_003546 [Recurvomyces mirabilis]KAK5154423.1 hypothetical protein LTS14_006558 [Recurvomyces mirabilis]